MVEINLHAVADPCKRCSCSREFTVRRRDASRRTLRTAVMGRAFTAALCLTLYGSLVAAQHVDTTPVQEFHEHQRAVLAVAFSPDGHLLASGGEDARLVIHILKRDEPDTNERKRREQLLHDLDSNRFLVRQRAHEALAVMGPEVVEDLEACLRSTHSAEVRRRVEHLLERHRQPTGIGHERAIRDLAFSPDGKAIASAGHDDSVRFWHASTGKTFQTLRAHSDGIWALRFTPDGRSLLTGGGDNQIGVWDTVTYRRRQQLTQHQSTVQALAMSPDGRFLASAGGFDATVGIWDIETGESIAVLTTRQDSVMSLAFHPHQPVLVVGGYGRLVTVWDTKSFQPTGHLEVDVDIVRALNFSSDGRWLAVAGKGDDVPLIDWSTRRTDTTLAGHTDTVFAATFSPDGTRLATGDDAGVVRLWAVPPSTR